MSRLVTPALLAFALALGAPLRANESAPAVLPPEATEGEWLQDSLDDASLWFAQSDNFVFESVAAPVAGSGGTGRRWVGVVGGQPAWIIYYVPGELLGFEADTWHHGGAATDFRFFTGAALHNLAETKVVTEPVEIRDAWLRVLHACNELPANGSFLMIQFPADIDREGCRLAEVWLRFREQAGPAAVPAEVEMPAAIAPAPATDANAEVPPPASVEPTSPVVEQAIVEEPATSTSVAAQPEVPAANPGIVPAVTDTAVAEIPAAPVETPTIVAPKSAGVQPAAPVKKATRSAPERLFKKRGPRSK